MAHSTTAAILTDATGNFGWHRMHSRPLPWRAAFGLSGMVAILIAAGISGQLALPAEGLALTLLSLFITAVVTVFAWRHLRADAGRARFVQLSVGLALATAMVGLADNVLLLAAAWLVTGRIMVALLGHVKGWGEAQAAARRASHTLLLGAAALAGALGLLAFTAGSLRVGVILASVPQAPPALVGTAVALLGLSALVRCAAPPFSGWLMGSLAAPTPVSALMHAGFVNAGGFLMIRFAPAFEAVPTVRMIVMGAGIAAAVFGSAVMLVRSDVKGTLAASTVAQMGFMLLSCALGAYAAALWHMVAHGMFKAWLFLGSGGTLRSKAKSGPGLAEPIPALIALVTIAGAVMLIETPLARTGLLPVGLGMAALLVAIVIALPGRGQPHAKLVLAAVPALLVAVNVAALALVHAVTDDAAIPLLSPYAQLALLSFFLAAWVWQQGIAAGSRVLPTHLHARLIHAGAHLASNARKD